MTCNWNGIYKVIEEAGELLCDLGKLQAFPTEPHPDGKGRMRARVLAEAADVLASVTYLLDVNCDMDEKARVQRRMEEKLAKYRQWGLSGMNGSQEPAK